MNTILVTCCRTAAFASSLLVLSASAKDTASVDRVSQLLATRGSIPMHAVGPYVEVGTFRIQVSAKLGRPSAQLNEGTWLYENFKAEGTSARGTLIVGFKEGRVSSLSLATPAVVAALRNTRDRGNAHAGIASRDRR